jgi:DNA polymerase-3 subunit gamma/tau
VLKNAIKSNLHAIKGRWGDLLEMLAAKQMRSQAALLSEAEPVAASDMAVVIKFKYEIHCQMAMENTRFTETASNAMLEYTGKRMQVIGVPEDQWLKIRESFISQRGEGEADSPSANEDPLITEAQKLFGDELIQIQD